MKNQSTIIIALFLMNYGLFAQKNKFSQQADTSLIEHATADGWIYFKEKPFEAEQLFAKNNKSFGLATGSTMKVKKLQKVITVMNISDTNNMWIIL
jgi:hypothetical protein